MTATHEPAGTLEAALAHAARLLDSKPALAEAQSAEILKVAPGHPVALMLLGAARRALGNPAAALEVLEPLARAQPNAARAHFELARARAAAGRGEEAIAALRHAVALKPDFTEGWLALGDHLSAAGDSAGADAAYAQHIRSSTRDPQLLRAAAALHDNRVPEAEALLRAHLTANPTDIVALRLLAEVGARLNRLAESARLLELCLELAPSFHAARQNHAQVLQRQGRFADALREVEHLLALEPDNPGWRSLKAGILAAIGENAGAALLYAGIVAAYPNQAKQWLSYGHVLKAAGRLADCVHAYRRAIAVEPAFGEAYWSLANLKTVRFTSDDLAAMRAQLARAALADEDRFHFDFALGKALEDAALYADSFAHYAAGNRLRRASVGYDADATTARVRRARLLFSPEFFAQRRGFGAVAQDPIFIVGLPRAGSTLIEQILSSHSSIEGTAELPDIVSLVRQLTDRLAPAQREAYPGVLARLDAAECAELGERYLRDTRIQRRTPRPFFIDKMPNNFPHVGLIHMILPHAKIIDARRHPLSCCFSGFKQHFARGQHFSYDLEDIGRYYSDYVELMAVYDRVLPGRVHRVFYEELVEHTETEVRRLLEYCGLPFEDECLRFNENDRAVRTASSEQVRRPIFREGIDHWRHYEPWLGPLKEALGAALEYYPGVPPFEA
jgi:predicted Zn-dependent protease